VDCLSLLWSHLVNSLMLAYLETMVSERRLVRSSHKITIFTIILPTELTPHRCDGGAYLRAENISTYQPHDHCNLSRYGDPS
jgi:hypothetical protein